MNTEYEVPLATGTVEMPVTVLGPAQAPTSLYHWKVVLL
jgi:hypothetical protein